MAGAPDYGVRRLPQLDLALGTRHRLGGRSGLRWAIRFAHQHLLFHPFARGRIRAEFRQLPGEASARRMGDEVLLENKGA